MVHPVSLLVGGLGRTLTRSSSTVRGEKKRAMISTKAALAAAKVRGTLRRPGNPNATLDTLASPADDVCHH